MFRQWARLLGLSGVVLLSSPAAVLAKEREKQGKTVSYIWGNGVYQARPDALLQFRNFEPKRITTLTGDKSMRMLRFSEYYEAGIDTQGRLYVWPIKPLDSNAGDNKDQVREGLLLLEKSIKDVRFTKGYVWTLNEKGEVYQWPIVKKLGKSGTVESVELGEKRHVKPFGSISQIATGEDHIIALNSAGEVYSMGDDTTGQCGTGEHGRATHPPFTQKRVTYPEKIPFLPKIQKIASGKNHCLAVDEAGSLYGWGSNSVLQLSHEEEFSRVKSPLLCSFVPLKITRNIDSNTVKEVAAGDQFSVLVTENRMTGGTQVFSTGCNLKGQLAIGQVKHLNDVIRIQGLSNYTITQQQEQKKVSIEQLQCGNNHCIALLNVGYVMEWGDNEYGQMGNKKRSLANRPILVKQFVGKKVKGVFASHNSSGVIVEDA